MAKDKGWNIRIGKAVWDSKIFTPDGEDLRGVCRIQLDLQPDRLPEVDITVLPHSLVLDGLDSSQIKWQLDEEVVKHLRTDQVRKLRDGLSGELDRRRVESREDYSAGHD